MTLVTIVMTVSNWASVPDVPRGAECFCTPFPRKGTELVCFTRPTISGVEAKVCDSESIFEKTDMANLCTPIAKPDQIYVSCMVPK